MILFEKEIKMTEIILELIRLLKWLVILAVILNS